MAKRSGNPIAMNVVSAPVEEDSKVSELVTRLEAETARHVSAGSVTLRWGREQIAMVKCAAELMGVPYQT